MASIHVIFTKDKENENSNNIKKKVIITFKVYNRYHSYDILSITNQETLRRFDGNISVLFKYGCKN